MRILSLVLLILLISVSSYAANMAFLGTAGIETADTTAPEYNDLGSIETTGVTGDVCLFKSGTSY